MAGNVPRFDPGRFTRLAAYAAAIAVAAVALFALAQWVGDRLDRVAILKTRLALLIAAEGFYAAVVAALLVAAPVLSAIVLLGRKRRRPVRGPARGLLLAGSLLISILMAEACAWAWWRSSHRSGAAPAAIDRATPRNPRATREWVPSKLPQLPDRFEDRPAGEPREILILGESSAEGVPYNYWVTPTHIVTWQLEKLIPGLRVRPHIMAGSGDTLENQHEKLSKLTRRPDAVIVYCGHNEFSGRFHWAREVEHYEDGDEPSWWALAVRRFEALSSVGHLFREAADRCRVAIPPPKNGYRYLVDVPSFSPEEYDRLVEDFERRLEDIVRFATRIGAVPILISPPANDSGFEPNRSYLSPRTTADERAAFERTFRSIRSREDREPDRCVAEYRDLLERHPGFAELHYRLARLLERQGDWEGGYEHARSARDLDGLPSRCPSRFQEAYRRVAARQRCPLIDGQAYFHQVGPHGLLDDHLFHDGMHPSLRGQIALAQAILQALRGQGAFGWPAGTPVPQIDPSDCVEHFALIPEVWRRVALWGVMFYDLTASLRYDPSSREQRSAAFSRAAARIEAGEPPENVGLPNIGHPEAVPLMPDAATVPDSSGPEATAPDRPR